MSVHTPSCLSIVVVLSVQVHVDISYNDDNCSVFRLSVVLFVVIDVFY